MTLERTGEVGLELRPKRQICTAGGMEQIFQRRRKAEYLGGRGGDRPREAGSRSERVVSKQRNDKEPRWELP